MAAFPSVAANACDYLANRQRYAERKPFQRVLQAEADRYDYLPA